MIFCWLACMTLLTRFFRIPRPSIHRFDGSWMFSVSRRLGLPRATYLSSTTIWRIDATELGGGERDSSSLPVIRWLSRPRWPTGLWGASSRRWGLGFLPPLVLLTSWLSTPPPPNAQVGSGIWSALIDSVGGSDSFILRGDFNSHPSVVFSLFQPSGTWAVFCHPRTEPCLFERLSSDSSACSGAVGRQLGLGLLSGLEDWHCFCQGHRWYSWFGPFSSGGRLECLPLSYSFQLESPKY